MLRIVAMLRLALVMTALFSSAAALPLVRGGEDMSQAGMHRRESPHRVEELRGPVRAGGVPGELAGGEPREHLLVSSEWPPTCGLASCLWFGSAQRVSSL